MTTQIETLWARVGFKPNLQQRQAILHTDGPLFLTAGPGSGKTRVLLWRALNLIVFHEVPPEEIFLGTFTEKAALQLRQGLTVYLSDATRLTGHAYDLSRMPIGTVHSICRRILSDRRFSRGRMRPGNVGLVDELDQYFAGTRPLEGSPQRGRVRARRERDDQRVPHRAPLQIASRRGRSNDLALQPLQRRVPRC